MASPFAISIATFLLIGAAAVALVMAFSGGGRVVEERFADLAVKMRVAQGVDEDTYEDPNLMRALFKWASKRVPAPDMESPEGERLAQQLQQAGYLRSTSAAHAYQVVRILIAIALGIVGFLAGAVMKGGAQPIMLALGGAVIGYVGPSYWLGRRARTRQNNIAKQLSDVLDLLCV